MKIISRLCRRGYSGVPDKAWLRRSSLGSWMTCTSICVHVSNPSHNIVNKVSIRNGFGGISRIHLVKGFTWVSSWDGRWGCGGRNDHDFKDLRGCLLRPISVLMQSHYDVLRFLLVECKTPLSCFRSDVRADDSTAWRSVKSPEGFWRGFAPPSTGSSYFGLHAWYTFGRWPVSQLLSQSKYGWALYPTRLWFVQPRHYLLPPVCTFRGLLILLWCYRNLPPPI